MKRGGGVSGAVSLVMIFCVMCLAVFAVLTLATADRERKLSEMTAQNAADYYEADRQAVEIVAALRSGKDLPEGVQVSAAYPDGPMSFSVPINEDQTLEVDLSETCEILRWQTVYTGSWEPAGFLTVWDGT